MEHDRLNQSKPNPILAEFQGKDAELAEQLLRLRRTPGASLQQRLRAIPHPQKRARRLGPQLVWAGLALLLVVLLATAVSPTAMARLGQFDNVIGQIHLTILEILPGRPTSVVVENKPVSLAEARAAIPFELAAPAYLPGELGEPEIFVLKLDAPIVTMRWRDRAGGFVQLAAHPANNAHNQIKNLIGAESSQTILINGRKGVLVSGAWDEASRAWSHPAEVTTLIWELDGVQYNLLSYGRIVPMAELIKIAESVQ